LTRTEGLCRNWRRPKHQNYCHLDHINDAVLVGLVELAEAGMAVGVQGALEGLQVSLRMFSLAVRRIAVKHRRRIGPAVWAFVPRVHPLPPGLGLAPAGIEYRNRRVVAVNPLRRQNVGLDRVDQGTDQFGAFAHPAGQKHAGKIHAIARKNLALPVPAVGHRQAAGDEFAAQVPPAGQTDGDGALVGIPCPFLADHDLPPDQPRHGLLGGLPAGSFLAAGAGAGLVPFRRVDAGDPHLDAATAPLLLEYAADRQ